MALTDTAIRNAKPRDKEFKLTDGGGLYLLVKPNGSRLWNMAYRFDGRQKKLSIGVYPTVGLAAARAAREAARTTLVGGVDPSLKKRLDKIASADAAATTFQIVAVDFIAHRKKEGAAERTIKKHEWLLSQVYPAIGRRPISQITSPEVVDILKRIEKSGRLETAREVRAICSRVFRYAIVTARAVNDPCAALVGATAAPTVTHHAAIFDPKEIGGLMRAVRGYTGTIETRAAIQLMALTFMRSEELRYAVWSEFDLEGTRQWMLPAKRMKMPRPHIVPLSRQAVALLTELKAKSTTPLLFPGIRSRTRPISENTINAALRRMGYATDEMTGHGFRRMASTALNEHGFEPDWVERQLAHKDPNKIRRAYNAAEYLPQRTTMMQWWADYLDRLAIDEEDLIG
jgi:integrase